MNEAQINALAKIAAEHVRAAALIGSAQPSSNDERRYHLAEAKRLEARIIERK